MLYIIYSTKKQKILFAFKDFLLFYKKFILCLQSEQTLYLESLFFSWWIKSCFSFTWSSYSESDIMPFSFDNSNSCKNREHNSYRSLLTLSTTPPHIFINYLIKYIFEKSFKKKKLLQKINICLFKLWIKYCYRVFYI